MEINPALQSAVLDKYARPFADKTAKIIDDLDFTIEKQDIVVEKQDKLGDKVKKVVSNLEGAGANFSDAFSRSSDGLKELSFGFLDIKGIIETVTTKFKALNDFLAPLSEIGNFVFGDAGQRLLNSESAEDKSNKEFQESNKEFKESINIFKEASEVFRDVINNARGATRTDTPALTNQSGNIIDAEFEEIQPAIAGNFTDKSQSKRKTNMFGESLDKIRNVFSGLGKIVGNLTRAFGKLLIASFSIIGSFLSLAAPVLLFGFLLYQVIKALGGWNIIADTINFVDLQLEKLGIAFLEAKKVFKLGLSKEDNEELEKRRDILSFKQKRFDDVGEVRELREEYTKDGKFDEQGFRQRLIDDGLASNYSTINDKGQIVDRESGAIIDARTTESRNLVRALQPSVQDVTPFGSTVFKVLKGSYAYMNFRKEKQSTLESSLMPVNSIDAKSPETTDSNLTTNINTNAPSSIVTTNINNNLGGQALVSEPIPVN